MCKNKLNTLRWLWLSIQYKVEAKFSDFFYIDIINRVTIRLFTGSYYSIKITSMHLCGKLILDYETDCENWKIVYWKNIALTDIDADEFLEKNKKKQTFKKCWQNDKLLLARG